MKIQFLGTGAAEGVPAMFCRCAFCTKARALGRGAWRTRSQVLIDGVLSVDFPPEAYVHSLRFGVNLSALRYLFVTHTHMDHFYAHDFVLRGYKYAALEEDVLHIYGNADVAGVLAECTRREMKEEVAPHLAFHALAPYSRAEAGEYRVLALPASHEKTQDCLLFYIERAGRGYLHFYDTGRVGDEVFDFLKDNGARVNAVAFDCTFAEKTGGAGKRHMGIGDDMLMKKKLEERRLLAEDAKIIVTHFSHNGSPTREKLQALEREYRVTAAYDGMELEI